MKKKAMIMAVASLGSMALIGTGFAGWVISANISTKAEGLITAYDVQDQRLKIADGGAWETKVSDVDASGKIVFGKPADAVAGKWFSFDDKVENEFLINTYNFKVLSGDSNDTAAFTVTPTIEVDEKSKTAWDQAVKDGIVADAKLDTTSALKLNGTNAVDVAVKVTFAWGTHFTVDETVVNPYTFYTAHGATDKIADTETTYGDDAATFMAKFKDIQSVKFILNIAVARA